MEQLMLSQKNKPNLTDKEYMEVRAMMLDGFQVDASIYNFRACSISLVKRLLINGIEKTLGFSLVSRDNELMFLYIKPENRKSGYGNILLSFLKIPNSRLLCSTDNSVLQKMLINNGFKTKDDINYYRYGKNI